MHNVCIQNEVATYKLAKTEDNCGNPLTAYDCIYEIIQLHVQFSLHFSIYRIIELFTV